LVSRALGRTANKRARKARFAKSPTGESDGGRPQTPSKQPTTDSSGAFNIWDPEEKGGTDENGPSTPGTESLESKRPSQCSSKCQRSSGVTLEGGQAKMFKQAGQPSYATVAREVIRIDIVCDGYPEIQVTRENFVSIQRAIGGLVDELPEE